MISHETLFLTFSFEPITPDHLFLLAFNQISVFCSNQICIFHFWSIFSPRLDDLDLKNEDEAVGNSCCGFLVRVLRWAIPLHLLLFLLLAIVCFVPITEEDYSCTLANNFKRSLNQMLHYTDGPPPLWEKKLKHRLFLYILHESLVLCRLHRQPCLHIKGYLAPRFNIQLIRKTRW